MDAFRLRRTVVSDYADYIQSFLTILDPRIRQFVDEQLAAGVLWPDPLLQLSPAYQAAESVEELSARGVLDPLCGALFRADGKPLRLHQHQRAAIDIAAERDHYVVTTGTGSGKSLTYLSPPLSGDVYNGIALSLWFVCQKRPGVLLYRCIHSDRGADNGLHPWLLLI